MHAGAGALPVVADELVQAGQRVSSAAAAAAGAAGEGSFGPALASFGRAASKVLADDADDVNGIAETLVVTADNYTFTDLHALPLA